MPACSECRARERRRQPGRPLPLRPDGLPDYRLDPDRLARLRAEHGVPATRATLERASRAIVALDDHERALLANLWRGSAGLPPLTACTEGQVLLHLLVAELLAGRGVEAHR